MVKDLQSVVYDEYSSVQHL
ncbi:hypothetical protein RDI58_000824 [Solanum bulbocastanum]|uniref:Uncharacterized protein n=1 Tax=Solanum bulbocastanum TaxID=147425 RepID=A0AAN8YPE5_SOLBU